jgi:membrane protease YdiL (CAAX protease family)
MSTAETSTFLCAGIAEPAKKRHSAWDYCELIVGYGLILAVIWTQRPLQRWLYWIALAWFVASFVVSFPGWKAMGCSIAVFWRSWWVVGVALLLGFAAALLASSLHTLHHPGGAVEWVKAYGGYTVWAVMQQFLLQGYFLIRLQRILPSATFAAITAATIFAIAHLPNPILTPITLLWGLAACLVFLRVRNIWPLAIAHAIFGICVAITIPGPVVHNMRVGRGYLTYRAPRHLHMNHKDQTVSTVAWVREDAPTRR